MNRRGRTTLSALITLLTILLAVISAIADLDDALSNLTNAQQPLFERLQSFLALFTLDVTIPRWLFFILVLLSLLSILRLVRTVLQNTIAPELRLAEFRHVRFRVEVSGQKTIQIIDDNYRNARCAICNGRLIGGDQRNRGSGVLYLQCENDHNIGGKVDFAIYEQREEAAIQEAEAERAETESNAKRLREELLKELNDGYITEEEMKRRMGAEPQASTIRYSSRASHTQVYSTPDDFYSALVRDFLEEFERRRFQNTPRLEINSSDPN